MVHEGQPALLDELAQIDNVYLPDPGDGRYQEVEVDGLRIAGFNDPRWYGDPDDGSTDATLDLARGLADADPSTVVLRLSRNWLGARLMTVYVEIFRNVPLLLWILVILALFTEVMPAPRDYRPAADGAAGAQMKSQQYGRIINIASLAGLTAVPGEGVYAASKHAVMGFSLSTMADLRAAKVKDVHISCICPDGIWTPMLHDKLDDPEAALSFSGVLLQPEDVVAGVAKVLDRPRPITALPAWRGIVGRAGSLFPRLSAAVMPLVVRQGRRVQRRMLQERRRGDVVPERDRG